jgi:2',3'-cyclic-nucleotide 2'-phosphodiesterase (5'-nucleotidase family)
VGGLPRRATYVEQLRRERKAVLLLDTGDLLHSRSSQPGPETRKVNDLKADLFMKAYNLMGYDAFTPGEMDLSFGVAELIRMGKEARFPFLLANLIDVKSKKTVFQPFLIKEVQGVRIGITGLISNELPLGIPPEEKGRFTLSDPFSTAVKVIAELKKKKCRVIVVMAHMENEEQERLAKEVRGIDFILSGHLNYQVDPIKTERTEIFFAGARGENLGDLDFVVEKKLDYRFTRVSLTTQFGDQPQMQEILNNYKTKMKELSEPQKSSD